MFAGIDVGSRTTKAVLIDAVGTIRARAICATRASTASVADELMQRVLLEGGIDRREISYTVATGYGRGSVPFAQRVITEITCSGKGARWRHPDVSIVVDIGGQDSKAIRVDGTGRVANFIMNDKCAAGTGRYLERIAKVLQVPIDRIGPRSLSGHEGLAQISSYCAIFAQNDALRCLREGVDVEDILAGACAALAKRLASLARRVGPRGGMMVCGGVALNVGVVNRLEAELGVTTLVPEDAQFIPALGAALMARQYSTVSSGSFAIRA